MDELVSFLALLDDLSQRETFQQSGFVVGGFSGREVEPDFSRNEDDPLAGALGVNALRNGGSLQDDGLLYRAQLLGERLVEAGDDDFVRSTAPGIDVTFSNFIGGGLRFGPSAANPYFSSEDGGAPDAVFDLPNLDDFQIFSGFDVPFTHSGDPSALGTEVVGTDGADVLEGAGGDDTLEGLGGDDTLDGGAGNDVLDGGEDEDVFLFVGDFGDDTIRDYDIDDDRIEFSGVSGLSTVDHLTFGGEGDGTVISVNGQSVVVGGGGEDALRDEIFIV